ncbi:hypothetical protein EWB00_009334, partial [Schistosoma japonicum]
YTVSLSQNLHDFGALGPFRSTRDAKLLTPDIRFQVTVHQFSYRSVLAFRSELTFFMANSFESGNRVRAFRIVGVHSKQDRLTVNYYSKIISIVLHILFN